MEIKRVTTPQVQVTPEQKKIAEAGKEADVTNKDIQRGEAVGVKESESGISSATETLESLQTSKHVDYREDVGFVVGKSVDKSGDIVRQVPPENVLKIKAKLQRQAKAVLGTLFEGKF